MAEKHGCRRGGPSDMHSPYELLAFEPDYEGQALEVQRHLWSPDLELNSAYFKWKYRDNPYVDEPIIQLAAHNGKIVGMRGMFGARWEVGANGNTVTIPCAGDLVVDPEHRSRGLVESLTRALLDTLQERGYPYAFTLSASPTTMINCLRLGWRSIGWITRMAKGDRLEVGYTKRKLFRDTHREDHPLHVFDRKTEDARNTGAQGIRVSRQPEPEAMAALIQRLGFDGRIRHVRDKEYFSWRFRSPLSTYRFLFHGDSRLDGYLVLQGQVHAYEGSVSIVDWEATDAAVQRELLEAAQDLGQFRFLDIWSDHLSGEAVKVLEDNGFEAIPDGGVRGSRRTVLVQSTSNENGERDWSLGERRLLDLANWDLRMLYSDGH